MTFLNLCTQSEDAMYVTCNTCHMCDKDWKIDVPFDSES